MKRTSFALAAALALVVNACEMHPAAQTAKALHTQHEESTHETPGHAVEGGAAEKHDVAPDKANATKESGAVKYFPEGEKK
jgi:hypothetical protein